MVRCGWFVTIASAWFAAAVPAADQYVITVHAMELSWQVEGGTSEEDLAETLNGYARQHEPSRTDVRTVETMATLGAPFYVKASQDNETFELGGRLSRAANGQLRLDVKPRMSHWNPSNTVLVPTSDAGRPKRVVRPRRTEIDTTTHRDESKMSVVFDAELWEEAPPTVDTSLAIRPRDDRKDDRFLYDWRDDYLVLGGLTQIKAVEPQQERGALTSPQNVTMEFITSSFIIQIRKFVPGPR